MLLAVESSKHNQCTLQTITKQHVTLFVMLLLTGGIVLPLLGAVPDSAIIIVSGLGDDAQEKLSVGMGYDIHQLIHYSFVYCLDILLALFKLNKASF